MESSTLFARKCGGGMLLFGTVHKRPSTTFSAICFVGTAILVVSPELGFRVRITSMSGLTQSMLQRTERTANGIAVLEITGCLQPRPRVGVE